MNRLFTAKQIPVKSIQFLIILIFSAFSVFPQQTLSTLDIGIKRVGQLYGSLSFIHKVPGSGSFFVALAEENNVHFYLFDNDWKAIAQFKENREWVTDQSIYQDYKRYMTKSNVFFSPEFEPIGSMNAGNKQFLIAFLRNHKLYFQKVDFTTGKSSNLELWEPLNKEKVLHTFSFNNKIYWVTHSKKNEDSIGLNRYNSAGKIETKNVSIRRLRTVDNIFRPGSSSIGSDFIDSDKQLDLLKASARIKFYAQNNSFKLVSDEIRGKTQIISVNLDNFEESSSSIDHTTAGSSSFISTQNSFLLNDLLLQVNVCEGTFTFTIHNLLTRQQSSYSFNKDQEIDFRNTEVMQYGKALFTQEERKLNKTSQFIRKVDGSGLSVVANSVDDVIEITMGSSQLIETRGGNVYTPAMSVGPGGAVHLPARWMSSGYYETSTKTIFFKSLFNKNDLKHVKSPLPLDDKMKTIDEFFDKKKDYAFNAIIDGKEIITGYVDRETKKVSIVRF